MSTNEALPEEVLKPVKILLDYDDIRDFQGWETVFGRNSFLKVDIGCGKDDALILRAKSDPDCDYIGIENDRGIAYRLETKIRRSGVTNLRVICFEGHFVIKNFFQEESIQSFSIQFPDPWPKKRHHRRRIMNEDFVRLLHAKLQSNGDLFIITDFKEISEIALELVQKFGGFKLYSTQKPFPFTTLYESKFIRQGLPIYYLCYKKSDRT